MNDTAKNKSSDCGVQPLDQILNQLSFDNHSLVEVSTEQLTHKQVQKARQGRRVTRNIQFKILNALNALCEKQEKEYQLKDLFTY